MEDDVVAKATALLSVPGVRPGPGPGVPGEEERPSTTNVGFGSPGVGLTPPRGVGQIPAILFSIWFRFIRVSIFY
jgi:hypothetical protein